MPLFPARGKSKEIANSVASTTDATGATTAFEYDALGRQTSITNALGLVTATAYDPDGNVVSQRGAQYPVDYVYDAYGRMKSMKSTCIHRSPKLHKTPLYPSEAKSHE